MITEYLKSIALLEKRKAALLDGEIPGCKQDCLSRLALIENELDDLYAIVRYLTSPTPRREIFNDFVLNPVYQLH